MQVWWNCELIDSAKILAAFLCKQQQYLNQNRLKLNAYHKIWGDTIFVGQLDCVPHVQTFKSINVQTID